MKNLLPFLVAMMLFVPFTSTAQKLTFTTFGDKGFSGEGWSMTGTNPVTIHATGNAKVSTDIIEDLLNKSVDVSITSDGSIILEDTLQVNPEQPTQLRILAKNEIIIGASAGIQSTTPLHLYLLAEKSINLHPDVALISKGGDVYIQAFENHQALKEEPESSLNIQGLIDASSEGTGGKIVITADEVLISKDARIRSNGSLGGGKILIGGDWQGGSLPELREPEDIYEAMAVTVDKGAFIDASATLNGDGGKVVVWSNINHPRSNTFVQGDLLALGGKLSGKGGHIETSGGAIDFDNINVSTLAADGSAGEWLIDPWNFFFNSTQLSNLATNLALNNISITTGSSSASGSPTTFFGRGHIVFEDDFTYTSLNNSRTLTLNATRGVWIKGNISSTGGSFNLTFSSFYNVYINGDISTNGGSVQVNNGAQIHFQKTSGTQTVNTSGGSISFGNSNVRLLRHNGSLVLNSGSGNIDWNNSSGSVEQIDAFTNITDIQVMGWGGRHCASTKDYTFTTNDGIVVTGREYSIRFRLWGTTTFNTMNDIRVGDTEYFRVYKDGNTLNDFWTPNGSQYNVIDNSTIDVTFLANHTGNLRTITNVSCIGWDPQVEIEWVRETTFPTTNYSIGSRSLELIATSGIINTGLKAFTGLASLTVTTNESGSSRIDGIISGTTNFTKSGTGTIRLVGNNTYSGTTTISAGILQLGINGTTGSLGTGAVTNNASFVINRSDNFTLSNPISGTGSLTKQGNGIATLTSNNTYSGTTTISAGTLQAGNNGTTGSLGTGALTNNASFVINRSDNFTLSNPISGTGSLTKQGNGIATLTSNNTYSGTTTINAGTLVLQNDAPSPSNKTFNGTGQLRIEPASSSFTSAFSTSGWTFNNTLTGLTIGKATNSSTVTLATTTSIAGPITVYGGNIDVTAALTATNANINLHATGYVTQSAALTANGLGLNGAGNFALTNAANNIATLAGGTEANQLGSLSLTDASGGLTIGSVNPSGIYSTGPILIETLEGNITLSENIATLDATTDAIILNAGKSKAIGDISGGDILVVGTPAITMGQGGIAKLFSGSEATSTGLTTLAGGTTNLRFGVDETTTTFDPFLLADNLYALYRLTTNVIWVGGVSNAWNNASNWNPNIIPTAQFDAEIPTVANGNYYPVVPAGSDVVTKNLTISAPVPQSLTIENGGKLTVTGSYEAVAGAGVKVEGQQPN